MLATTCRAAAVKERRPALVIAERAAEPAPGLSANCGYGWADVARVRQCAGRSTMRQGRAMRQNRRKASEVVARAMVFFRLRLFAIRQAANDNGLPHCVE